MRGQRLGIANVHQAREQLQSVNEARTGFAAAFDAKAEQARSLAAEIALYQGFVRAVVQAWVIHPLYFVAVL